MHRLTLKIFNRDTESFLTLFDREYPEEIADANYRKVPSPERALPKEVAAQLVRADQEKLLEQKTVSIPDAEAALEMSVIEMIQTKGEANGLARHQ